MAQNDIYNNEGQYERFMRTLDRLLIKPENDEKSRTRKYYCKNEQNLKYFRKLNTLFRVKDQSFIHRLRIMRVLLIHVHTTNKDLAECERDDVNEIVVFGHTVNKTIKTKTDFIKHTKWIWKQLFPEKDERGRIDETIVPYPVRHLSPKIDKSLQKRKQDKLTWAEYEKLVGYFSEDPQMQCYITLAVESFGRPQEMCYTKIRDVEIYDNYAKIYISEHGKEGVKFLQCIDSFYYFMRWYELHPHKNDQNAFLFISNKEKNKQLTPSSVNKRLKKACRVLEIDKKITPYSLKRNGITFARLKGDSDVAIQHRAGWTSLEQLKTYDLSTSEDSFRRELIKRGLIENTNREGLYIQKKRCMCGAIIALSEHICTTCKQLTNKQEKIESVANKDIVAQVLLRLVEKNKPLIIETLRELQIGEKMEGV